MSLDAWDEVRTAFHVARFGTVSAAAAEIGVHHATVIRHVDALEARLGTKLFQRHARGYTATEAGQDLLRVAEATDDQFTQLAGRLRGRGAGVSGEVVVTTLEALAPLLAPALAGFGAAHPQVVVRLLTGDRVLRLEYGEAHVAVRAGAAPGQPDNVVQRFATKRVGLYAAPAYLEARGRPAGLDDLDGHLFVGSDREDSRAPSYRWMAHAVPRAQVVFRGNGAGTLRAALLAGAGLGFMPEWEAADHPQLVRVHAPLPDWDVPLWLVTHVDLHRTAKVQALLAHLKAAAEGWEGI